MHPFLTLGLLSVLGHPLIIRRRFLSTQYKVAKTSYHLYASYIGPGFRLQPTPIALLQRWYSHVREKRQTRQDFLKSLVKVFQENSSYESTQVGFLLISSASCLS